MAVEGAHHLLLQLADTVIVYALRATGLAEQLLVPVFPTQSIGFVAVGEIRYVRSVEI
jgi:hypothetical protein